MALPFVSTWTGTNGDTWGSVGWDFTGNTPPNLEVNGNKGRMLPASGAFAQVDCYMPSNVGDTISVLENDITFDLFPNTGNMAEATYFKMTGFGGGLDYEGDYPSFRLQLDTKAAEWGSGNGASTWSYVAGDTVHVRLQNFYEGANFRSRARYWLNSDSEPGTWTNDYTNTTPDAPQAGLRQAYVSFVRASATSGPYLDLDNLTFDTYEFAPYVVGNGTQVSTTTGADLNPAYPAGYSAVDDDHAFIWITAQVAAGFDPDAITNWTRLPSFFSTVTAPDGFIGGFYRKLAAGNTMPTVTFNANYTGVILAQVQIVRNLHISSLIDVTAVTSSAAASDPWTPTGLTTLTDKAFVVSIDISDWDNALTVTTAQGFTAQMQGAAYDLLANWSFGLATKVVQTAGAVTCPTWDQTVNATNSQLGYTIAFKPYSAATVPDQISGIGIVQTDQSIILNWSAPGNGGSAITDYDVDWSDNGGSSWLGPVSIGSTTPAYTISGLTNGTEYTTRARAVNAIGDGAWSPNQLATPKKFEPWWRYPNTMPRNTFGASQLSRRLATEGYRRSPEMALSFSRLVLPIDDVAPPASSDLVVSSFFFG